MADARIARLLERGLRHFALGELEHAVGSWQQVLALDPGNERAREYLQLVEQTVEAERLPAGGEGLPTGAETERAPVAGSASDPHGWFDDVGYADDGAMAAEGDGASPGDWFSEPQRLDDLPPVAPGALPWQEWHSEVGLNATGELPWDIDSTEVPSAPAAGTGQEPGPTARAEARSPQRQAWGADGEAITLEDEVAPHPAPGATGWDVTDAGGAVELADDGSDGGALDLLGEGAAAPVAVPRTITDPARRGPDRGAEANTLMQGARELFDLGDFSGSLELVQKALSLEPQHREALGYLERNQDTLVQMYESKLGSLEARPRVVLRPDEIVWLNLDHRAGFVLAQIDGTITVDDLYAVSGLSRLDTAKILAELVEQGVIAT